jgi:hypothetical protein
VILGDELAFCDAADGIPNEPSLRLKAIALLEALIEFLWRKGCAEGSGCHRSAAHEASMGSEFTAGMAELHTSPAGVHLTKSARHTGELQAQAFTT